MWESCKWVKLNLFKIAKVLDFVVQILNTEKIEELIKSMGNDKSKLGHTLMVRVASVCSGMGVAEMVLDQLNFALKELRGLEHCIEARIFSKPKLFYIPRS